MRYTTSAVACALVLVAATAVHASDAMKAIVNSYFEMDAALAADRTDALQPAVRAIAEQAGRMGAEGSAILSAAQAVEKAADLKAARVAFGDLSDAVIAAAKAEGWKDLPDVKVAYCPMVKRSWLQKSDKIENPYYGPAMLTCGEIKTR